MPTEQYVGKAGHLAVMGELCLRGYNAAMPEIDKGDDIFVVNDAAGTMWRVQVKTSQAKQQLTSNRFQFRVRDTAIQNAVNPPLHFLFVMRDTDRWRFLVLDRAVLRNYANNNAMGSLSNGYRQIYITIHSGGPQAGKAICSSIDVTNHLEDWAAWPVLPSATRVASPEPR